MRAGGRRLAAPPLSSSASATPCWLCRAEGLNLSLGTPVLCSVVNSEAVVTASRIVANDDELIGSWWGCYGAEYAGLGLPEAMEGQANTATVNLDSRVKANLVLGVETFAISSESGILSEQLAAMKEKSMVILKEYITKHNAPNDVPDESVEGESDDEVEPLVKNPPKKSKKQK
ncbi:hypothetical protein EJB05_40940, partial [Eragrostis curvula]